MIYKNFDGVVPEIGERNAEDDVVLAAVDQMLVDVAGLIERVELRAGLRAAMDAAQSVNAYLNATEPWRLAKRDPERSAVVLVTALEAIAGLRVGFAPYLPFSTAALDEIFGPVESWARPAVAPGTVISKPSPLYPRIDLDELDPDSA